MKSNLKFGIWIILAETIIIIAIWFIQPLCEPCLPDQFCPACLNEDQIYLMWLGIGILGSFLIWQLVRTFRKLKDKKPVKVKFQTMTKDKRDKGGDQFYESGIGINS